MAKRKIDAKTFAGQKRKRRQWLTFMRMIRYGINNFSRNAWLTIAATAVMTITLLIVFMTLTARNVLIDTVSDIQSKVDMSIYVKHTIKSEDARAIETTLRALSSVTKVSYVDPAGARQAFAERYKDDPAKLRALNEATSSFTGTFRVGLKDINDTAELDNFTKTNKAYLANQDPEYPPSFAGERRESIQNIGRAISFAEKLGAVASVVFVVISSLIVFNTIRMAIFNRREEIQMMKLIGAERNFIRGPFVVEAVVYGFIAAVLATASGIGILYAAEPKLSEYGIAISDTLGTLTIYIGFVLLAMIVLGALIGVISALFATRKYLRI